MTHFDEQETLREEVGDLSGAVCRGPRTRAVFTVLRGTGSGGIHPMEGGLLVIGRAPDADITIRDDTLSRRHACVRRSEVGHVLEDLGSTNGTFLDGEPVQGPTPLPDGARIHLGKRAVLHYRLHDDVERRVLCETHARALLDPLTGVFNRRHLQECLGAEVAFARRHRTPVSLLLLDIDHFKRINDQHGHAVGDAALQCLANALRELTRDEDTLARYGGEEFALLARGIEQRDALQLGERIRQVAEALALDLPRGPVSFTVSVGIAHGVPGGDCSPAGLLEAADQALYASKGAGRNAVSLAPPL